MEVFNYKHVINHIKSNNYSKIIITGPQRAGTRFTTNAVAYDLKYTVVDEVKYKIFYYNLFYNILKTKSNIVIQAPEMSAYMHNINLDDVLVVFMYRSTKDIIASQHRVGWDDEKNLKNKYKLEFKDYDDIDYSKPISEIKYYVWENIQVKNMKVDHINLSYDSIEGHPMWIDKSKRVHFKGGQIK